MINMVWCRDCKVNSVVARSKQGHCPVCHGVRVFSYAIQGSAKAGKAKRGQAMTRQAHPRPHTTLYTIGLLVD